MRKINISIFISSFILTLVTCVFIFPTSIRAAGNFSVSSSSPTVGKGSTVTIRVNANTGGDLVNAVQLYLSYPQDKLSFQSVSTVGSVLSIVADKTGGGGVVSVAGGVPSPGFSGSKFIASVTFKALTDTNTAVVAVRGDSQMLRDSDNQNISTGGNSVTLSLSGTSPSQVSPTVSQAQSSSIISNLKQTQNSNGYEITWNTSVATSSFLEYGPTTNYGFEKTVETKNTVHKVDLAFTELGAGEQYFVRVRATDSAGKEVISDPITIKVPGSSITLSVLKQDKSPLSGATVVVNAQEYSTGTDGKVKLGDVKAGVQGVIVRSEGKSYIKEITVTDDVKEYTVTIDDSIPSSAEQTSTDLDMLPLYIGAGIVTVLAVVILAVYFIKKRKSV